VTEVPAIFPETPYVETSDWVTFFFLLNEYFFWGRAGFLFFKYIHCYCPFSLCCDDSLGSPPKKRESLVLDHSSVPGRGPAGHRYLSYVGIYCVF
jgi:hypothetical protein